MKSEKNKDLLSEEEINSLKSDQNLSLEDNIKNIITLCRNELNILDLELFKSDLDIPAASKKKIRNSLNTILTNLIKVRKY